MLVSCLAYYSTLNMEAIYSSETSVDLQRTTRCYILEDSLFITNGVRTSNPRVRYSETHLDINTFLAIFIDSFYTLLEVLSIQITSQGYSTDCDLNRGKGCSTADCNVLNLMKCESGHSAGITDEPFTGKSF
jgi:hypothetical protein